MDASATTGTIEQTHAPQADERPWFALIIAAVLLRILIAAISIGTNDARLFWMFASEIRQFGIVPTYGLEGLFNHPPLVAAWIKLAAYLTDHFSNPPAQFHLFSFIFKLPIIAVDALAAWLVWKIWRPRVGRQKAAAIAAAAAWSVCGILISAYHCNTDPMYAALCLAAVYFMDEQKAFLLAGLALGAAINVKIVPVLLIPGLVLSCQSFREARLFIAGLAIGVIPFVPVFWSEAPSFVHNTLAYNSNLNNWGLTCLLLAGKLVHGTATTSPGLEAFHEHGRYLIFLFIGTWAVVARLAKRWTRYEIAAGTFAIFLVFTPGFGVQYLAMIPPLLFAVRPRIAVLYSTAAGAFAGALYFTHLQPHVFPLQSVLGWFPMAESMLGLVAWAILAAFLVITCRRKPIAKVEDSNTGQPLPVSYTSARAA